MKCQRIGCDHDATHGVKFRVWARGYPKTTTPLELFGGLELCLPHAIEFTPKEMFSVPESCARIQNELFRLGRAEADFATAEAEVVPVEQVREFFRRASATR